MLATPEAPVPPPERNVPLDETLVAAAEQVVREMAASDDPDARAHAMEAVVSLPLRSATELLSQGLQDADPLVRFAAAMTAR